MFLAYAALEPMAGSRLSVVPCGAVLVRGVNWIGDAVMTIPALRAVRCGLPDDTRLSLLVKPWVSPLFEKDPDLDEIITYSAEFRGVAGKFRLAKELRKRGFCLAVLFQNAFDAALLAYLAGIPQRIGYSRDGRRFLLSHPVAFDAAAKKLHHIDYYLELIKRAGFPVRDRTPWIFLGLEERLRARALLKVLRRPVIAMNPGATYGSSKRWLPERFGEVASRIINELNGSVVLLGGPTETGIAGEILESLPSDNRHSLLNLAGATSLRELIGVISEADLLLTNDSGPMHIGYAVGTPLVAIFGSTSPELTGPVGASDVIIKKSVPCAPCFDRECRKNDLACMDLITSAEVFSALSKSVRTRRAVFIDRDGTLCRDADYLRRMEDLEIFPSVDRLQLLKDEGFSLIGVTNQSGIARGLVQEGFAQEVNRIFISRHGFDAFYCCPHHPEEHCSCRKPEPGMLIRARNEHAIDLRQSFVVGDKDEDMILARTVGAKGILVRTGKVLSSVHADAVAEDLGDAVKIILANRGKHSGA